jgi:hypothetical protein
MAVSSKYMSFRNARAQDLRQMISIVEKVVGGDIPSYKVHAAISQLQDKEFIPKLKDESTDESVWGYDIEDFTLPLDTLKHAIPTNIKKGEIILNMKLRGNIDDWDSFKDPFIELVFKVMVRGVGKDKAYHFGFHIDRHNGSSSKEPHPIYHLQYNFNPTESSDINLGDLFYIDTPRIMHKPMDFILGVGFLTSNFFPTGFQILSEEREFVKLNNAYQKSVWRPYFHTLANNWKPFDERNIIWNPIQNICPIIL